MSLISVSRSVPAEWMLLREIDLLRREVAARILRELLPEDENRVERRPQLVRHVREELGLVFRGERQLRGLLFERAARLLHFLVLALDFDVLLGELLRLERELLVGLLQLGLPRLQLDGQLLRLLQQVLRPHRRLDRVEHDADRLRELFEERQVRRGERLQRRQLDDGLRFAFEQHREHDDVLGTGGAEAGVDARVVGGDLGEQDALLFQRALTDEALADFDPLRLIVANRVAGEQRQLRRAVGHLAQHLIHGALLRVDQRRELREQELADRDEIALALEHAGELGEVGLQPVLLLVAVGGRRAGCRSSC